MLNEKFQLWFENLAISTLKPHDFLFKFIHFLNENDYNLQRVNLASTALHPEVEAQAYLFTSNTYKPGDHRVASSLVLKSNSYSFKGSTIRRIYFGLGVQVEETFLNSPIPIVWKTKTSIRININETVEDTFPIIKDLRSSGMTDYLVVPLIWENKAIAFMSFASSRKNGLSYKQVDELKEICIYISLCWNSFQQKEIIDSLLGLYLGTKTGKKVLKGKIKRGDLEKMEAIIWFSDIRDYTFLSSNYPSEEVVEWLNEYFQEQISIIHRFGGEVLKLLGDGILAVFPTAIGRKILTTARRAVIASFRSIEKIEASNHQKIAKGLPEIKHGIALHHGNVKYGNIGSKDRLDFTIIGNDVNLTARICSLCSKYKKDIILSDQISKLLPGQTKLIDKDIYLKGIKDKQAIYSLGKS